MKVACYLRVSTLDQAQDGYSIAEQEDKLKKFCDIKDWQVYKIYKDPGFTGSNINRPGMQNLIRDTKLKKFDTVLVYKLDRLSRSQKDTLYLIEDVFNANHVSFISLNESFDTSTPFGKASIGILSVFAQLEREQIKERMQMGKLGRARSGKAMGWSNVPFGYTYDDGVYYIDDFQASVVKKIYKNYLNGISISKLVNTLNTAGHLGKARPWSYKTIRSLLANPIYTGYTSYHGELFPGQHQAIISKDLFDQVQKELKIRQQQAYDANNNPRPFQSKYMVSGLLQCGYCGSNFTLYQYRKKKDGTRTKVYKCPSTMSKKMFTQVQHSNCPAKFYYMNDLEKYVLDKIEILRGNPKLITTESVKTTNDNSTILKQIRKTEHQLERLVTLYVDTDSFSLEAFNKKRDELKKRKEVLEKQFNNIKDRQPELNPKKAIFLLNEIKKNISSLSYDQQKLIVKQLVSKIELKGDNITIKWRFQV